MVTWNISTRKHRNYLACFLRKIRAQFGPPEGVDFKEALKKLQKTGSLQEYQEKIERLENKVDGWSKEALIGMFMTGLTMEITKVVRMFKPQSLKDTINLAHMKDGQV